MKYLKKFWILIVIAFTFFAFIEPIISILILGLILFYVSMDAIIFIERIQKKGIKCVGKILSLESNEGDKIPIVEFTTLNGKSIAKKPSLYSSLVLSGARSYKKLIGIQVSVLYDPSEPEKFILAKEKGQSYFVLAILFLLGLTLILLSVAGLLGFIKIN